MESRIPVVSIVIPTLRRPKIVLEAIASVLRQTYSDFELIVVVDGPDPATEQELAHLTDARIRVVCNSVNVGLAEARNVGVRACAGQWVAFLDDDDEWFPEKLECQLAVAAELNSTHCFVVSRFLERADGKERVWPEILPENTCRFSEYLFCNRGMLLPSGMLMSRALMRDVPFTAGLRHIEDLDWMLRATADPRTLIGVVPRPLFLYNNHSHPGRESRNFPWKVFLQWSTDNRRLMTDKAFSDFITRGVVPRAREAEASPRELLSLFFAAICASPRMKVLTQFLASSLFSRSTKRAVRDLISPSARTARQRAAEKRLTAS